MVTLLLLTLAVYRVAYLVAIETGPFALAERLRGAVFARFGRDHWLTEGVTCPLCVSFWLAALAAAVALGAGAAPDTGVGLLTFGVAWLGIAGAVLTLHLGVQRG